LLQETNLKVLRLVIHHGWSIGRVGSRKQGILTFGSGCVTIFVGWAGSQDLDPRATLGETDAHN